MMCSSFLSQQNFTKIFPARKNAAPQTPNGDRVRRASSVRGTRFSESELLFNSAPLALFDDDVKRLIVSIVNVFETGKAEGDYGHVSIYEDGPKDANGVCRKQITYGRSQTTEYGLLPKLLNEYVQAGGKFSREIGTKISFLRTGTPAWDVEFIQTLRVAGNDPVMRKVQDDFFDNMYWKPALAWWNEHGFTTQLAMLVIYDSFIHSGGILNFLRRRFDEGTPTHGGDERTWVSNYVLTRHRWLSGHFSPLLRMTTYRTKCLWGEVARGNWDLETRPIIANGTEVS